MFIFPNFKIFKLAVCCHLPSVESAAGEIVLQSMGELLHRGTRRKQVTDAGRSLRWSAVAVDGSDEASRSAPTWISPRS